MEKVSDKIDDTRSSVDKLSDKISARVAGPLPGGTEPSRRVDIPLNPVKEDWPLVNWWYKSPYLQRRSGAVKNTTSIPTLSTFIEDERGQPVDNEVRDTLFKDMRGFWNDRKDKNPPLTNWGNTGAEVSEEFRKLLEGKYPFLRLCSGHWKVAQLWSNYFSSWEKTSLVIDISSDLDEESSVGIKRKKTDQEEDDDDDEVHKRRKAKGKGVARPQPKAKKLRAKAGKVSNTFFR